MGCSTRHGGGEPEKHSLARLAVERGRVPSLRANRPTHAHRHCLDHPRRDRRWARGVASHAASRGAVSSGVPPHGGLLPSGRRRRRCGRGSLPVFPRKGEGCRTPCAPRGADGKRRPTHRRGRQRPKERGRRGRGSDARGRARASVLSLQKSSDGVRRREASALHFTRFGGRSGTGA